MNPSPETTRPFNPPPRLIDCRVNPPAYAAASLTRGFPIDYARLDAIEQQWGPARAELAVAMDAAGELLQSQHWRWRNKAAYYPPGWHCLVTIECEGQAQGMMAVETLLRPSILSEGGWVVYVDYVETAPWNYRIPGDRSRPAVRTPRFAGVGTILTAEAVRMSLGRTAAGRVGLHALAQAEEFYVNRCGMTRIGTGYGYENLVYFEYPEGVAADWLTHVRLSA